MGLYETLSESYPEEETVFGLCVLVPVQAFREEWKPKLAEEGVKVFQQSYNGRLFFFLKKPNSNNQTEATPTLEPSEPAKSFRRFEWTQADLEALKRMREQGLSLKEIARKLNRTKGSVLGKLRGLKEDSNGEVKPQIVNCEGDGLFKEYLEASQLLYPKFKRATALLLREASRVLENG